MSLIDGNVKEGGCNNLHAVKAGTRIQAFDPRFPPCFLENFPCLFPRSSDCVEQDGFWMPGCI